MTMSGNWLDWHFGPIGPPLENTATGSLHNVPSTKEGVSPIAGVRFTGAAPTVTGFDGGTPGRPMFVQTVGGPLVLANESASSSAANRITTGTGANVTIPQGGAAFLLYDATSLRWRVIGGASPGGSEVPAGDEDDVVGLDGVGGFKSLGPMVELPDPGTLTVGDMLYWSGTEWVRVPAGTEGQLLTWVSGAPAWADPAGGAFDPAALVAEHAFRAETSGEYDGLAWAGFATAGGSGGRSLDSASGGASAPTTGSAVNGYVPAVFATSATSATDSTTALSTLITAAAYTILMVVKPTTSTGSANATNRHLENAVLAELGSSGAYIGIGFSSSGFSAYHYDNTDYSGPAAAASLDTWHVVVARFGSGTLGISVDGGAEQTGVKGDVADSPGGASSRMLLGLNYAGSGSTGQTMEVLEYWVLPSRISDSDAAGYVAYAQARYGI